MGVRHQPKRASGFAEIHSGPTYVYVLSGNLEIVDSDGGTAAYSPGDFFPEAPGHVHTVQTAGGAEVFIL